MPISALMLKNFCDKGWIVSKVIGIAISGLTMWILSSIKIFKFTQASCYIIIVIFAIINGFIAYKNKSKFKFDKNVVTHIIVAEMIFFILLYVWVYIRGFTPQIKWDTEKFMDYGFMNACMNSDYMPPRDIWFSGHSINYYYFGHYISAYLSKIATTTVNEGYNLMIATIAAFTFIIPYSLGMTIGKSIINNKQEKTTTKQIIINAVTPVIIAVLAGTAICFGGTLYYPIYKWFVKADKPYFYVDATRYIGYRPETNDKTITEIPSYSSVVADLHAHFIDTIFALTMLAILLQVFLEKRDEDNVNNKKKFNFTILFIGILLGIQKMTNFWDFPIYLVIISAIFIFNELKNKGINIKSVAIAILKILSVVIVGELVTLPFTLNFSVNATEVHFTETTSPFYKLAVLWGFPTIIAGCYIIKCIIKFFKTDKAYGFCNRLWDYIKSFKPSEIFIAILGACAIGLILIPEIVYVKDIYGDDFRRTNTMFKLTYQAYILLSICTSYILVKAFYDGKIIKKILSSACLLIFITTFAYGIDAIDYVTGGVIKNSENRLGVEYAEDFIKKELPDDTKAIKWIRENIEKDKIILEKPSRSYTSSARISVFTGNATVLGWQGHEWLWRANEDYGPSEEEKQRWQETLQLYTTNNEEDAKKIIRKYNIDYIYIGNVEFKEFNKINIDLLKSLGEVVYEVSQNKCKNTPVYIIKVSN